MSAGHQQHQNENKEDDDVGQKISHDTAERQPLSLSIDCQRFRHNNMTFSERRFDVETLPADMRRVYGHLEEKYGEEYGLLFVFTMTTAVELHRAWNMTLLTATVLQEIKDKFNLRMTWNLGVIRLIFRVEDGGHELNRRVPYDYDSEFQDIYYRIAMALVAGQINVHEALLYQREAKHGLHTAKSGLFIRKFPGRLLLYPAQAATCAVIFFNGEWIDAAVAAICGLAAGLIEFALSYAGGQATVLLDVSVGVSTGLIGTLFFRYYHDYGEECVADPSNVDACRYAPCLSAVFLGTLYWFFYGTAFVIGILEIIAGELQCGVTRFIGVSVKTFVLSLGASLGLMLVFLGETGAADAWYASSCNKNFLDGKWWRIPFYLANCVFVLGQYRLPLSQYWRALIVQLVAYEVQFTVIKEMGQVNVEDNLDVAASNLMGAATGVIAAALITWVVNLSGDFFRARLLQEDATNNRRIGDLYFRLLLFLEKAINRCGLGRTSDIMMFDLEKKLKVAQRELKNPNHPRDRIEFPPEEEDVIIDAMVATQDINMWSILMPAVYQLVPGSIIAKLWFSAIFPTDPNQGTTENSGSNSQDSVFANLMVISTSIALGLIIGFAIFQSVVFFVGRSCFRGDRERVEKRKQNQDIMGGMYTAVHDANDDPDSTRHIERMEGRRSLIVSNSTSPLQEGLSDRGDA